MNGKRQGLSHFSIECLLSKRWTLFLDRDGVINHKLPDDYVKSWQDFQFLPGSLQALQVLSGLFSRIFIVTNQQGVGKGLMTTGALEQLHGRMLQEIRQAGGRIDKVYYCPDLKESHSLFRKPNIGMALQARKEHPGLQFREAIMVGDSLSDMQFGRKAGMTCVFISDNSKLARQNPRLIDLCFPSLQAFSNYLNPKPA